MKKIFSIGTLYLLAFLITAANVVICAVQSLNPDINRLPEGKAVASFASPDETSRIDIYLVESSIGTAVRGVYVSGDREENIYWQTGISTADVTWHSEESITINDIPLNVKTDKFDSRRGTAIFSEGLLAKR